MSRGPGRIERAIVDLIEKYPEGAWTTEDLCRLIYPTANRVEKKHRVAVIRAMRATTNKADDRYRDWRPLIAGTTGRTWILHNHANVMSYSLARIKAYNYRQWDGSAWVAGRTEEELLKRLQPGGQNHHLIIPGGAWDRHVRMHIAERDGDQETAEKLAAEQDMDFRVSIAGLRQALGSKAKF